MHNADTFLRDAIYDKGFKTHMLSPSTCMVDIKDSYVINFDGDIYGCPGFVGNKKFITGNIETGVIDYTELYKLDMWKNDECLNCQYLPLCFGGCRYLSFLETGEIKLVCQKKDFKISLETEVLQEIKHTRGNKC